MTEELEVGTRTVAVIGGGRMGADIAAVFAAGGWRTHVQEPAADVLATLPDRFAAAAKMRRGGRGARRRLQVHTVLGSIPWPDVALVIEAVSEKLALKQRLFREIEALAPREAILTTNSSSLRLRDVMARVRYRDRAAGAHWLTPAHVAPLVEVVRGDFTSAATIRRLNAWLRELDKLTINLQRDVPGMLVNRVQHAMMREAFNLIDRGIVSPEDVDTAVRFGFGFRYVACGPVRQRDLNGLVIHKQSAAQIYPTLHNGKRPAACLTQLVQAGRIGVRTGRGFYDWDRQTLAKELERYESLFQKALQLMDSDRRKALSRKRTGKEK